MVLSRSIYADCNCNLNCTQIKDINSTVAKVRVALKLKKNMTADGKDYKASFKRTSLYKTAKTDWYKLHETELGDATEIASLPIQSSFAYIHQN